MLSLGRTWKKHVFEHKTVSCEIELTSIYPHIRVVVFVFQVKRSELNLILFLGKGHVLVERISKDI